MSNLIRQILNFSGYPFCAIGPNPVQNADSNTASEEARKIYGIVHKAYAAGFSAIKIDNCVIITDDGYELLSDENVELLELG